MILNSVAFGLCQFLSQLLCKIITKSHCARATLLLNVHKVYLIFLQNRGALYNFTFGGQIKTAPVGRIFGAKLYIADYVYFTIKEFFSYSYSYIKPIVQGTVGVCIVCIPRAGCPISSTYGHFRAKW